MWNFDVLLNILPMDIFKDVKENEKKNWSWIIQFEFEFLFQQRRS